MTLALHMPGTRLPASRARSFVLPTAVASAAILLALAPGAQAAVMPVPLGTAQSFVVLAGAGITNTGPTTLNGDLGTFPTTSITGAGGLTVTGTNHGGDAVTQGAKGALVTAYDNAAGQGPTTAVAADLAGLTLAPGVYNSASSIGLSGVLTLDGGGDPNAVFVFQAGSTLTTASASQVNLVNGAQSCNVYWQVGSSATLGTGSSFRGSILALTDITVTTGTAIEGRVLARNGAVTLDTNTITRPRCAAATPTATPSTSATPRASATSTATPRATGSGGSGGSAGGSGSGGSSRQVGTVPSGPVDTGSYATAGGPGTDGRLVTAALGLVLLGGIAFVITVRRHEGA